MTGIQLVAVGDDTLEAIQQPDGSVWVSVRRVCEVLGISYPRQHQKLTERPWATVALKATVGADGREREMFAVHLDCLHLWLATIERVRPEAQEKLARFQCEARDVLAAHFIGGRKPAAPPVGDPLEVALQAALEIRREQRALAARVDTVADTAARALELADRTSRAQAAAREVKRRVKAAVGTITRNIQRHCAAHGVDFRAMFSAARSELGLRPTKEGGPSLGDADLRADQVLRLARFATREGVPGCSVSIVEAILNGEDDARVIEAAGGVQ
jgi:hypothetical protein